MGKNFISYMLDIETAWKNGRFADEKMIVVNVMNAALLMSSIPYEELRVMFDINNIRFIHDSTFTSECFSDVTGYMHGIIYLTDNLKAEYEKAIHRFFELIRKIQIEDTWSK